MNFRYSFPTKNLMHFEMDTCFAFEGMKMIGVQKGYECGVVYRVCCWLDALGIKFELSPNISDCMLYSQNKCEGDIKFYLD